jgi:hypothetical protein
MCVCVCVCARARASELVRESGGGAGLAQACPFDNEKRLRPHCVACAFPGYSEGRGGLNAWNERKVRGFRGGRGRAGLQTWNEREGKGSQRREAERRCDKAGAWWPLWTGRRQRASSLTVPQLPAWCAPPLPVGSFHEWLSQTFALCVCQGVGRGWRRE